LKKRSDVRGEIQRNLGENGKPSRGRRVGGLQLGGRGRAEDGVVLEAREAADRPVGGEEGHRTGRQRREVEWKPDHGKTRSGQSVAARGESDQASVVTCKERPSGRSA